MRKSRATRIMPNKARPAGAYWPACPSPYLSVVTGARNKEETDPAEQSGQCVQDHIARSGMRHSRNDVHLHHFEWGYRVLKKPNATWGLRVVRRTATRKGYRHTDSYRTTQLYCHRYFRKYVHIVTQQKKRRNTWSSKAPESRRRGRWWWPGVTANNNVASMCKKGTRGTKNLQQKWRDDQSVQ